MTCYPLGNVSERGKGSLIQTLRNVLKNDVDMWRVTKQLNMEIICETNSTPSITLLGGLASEGLTGISALPRGTCQK